MKLNLNFLLKPSSHFTIVTLLLLVALQLPFINADPDVNLSFSRGANTDEGLYSCQIRNYINHGDLTLNKSDGLAKTPLFSAILYMPFKLFGTTMLVGRLFMLLLSLVLFVCALYKLKRSYLYVLIGLVTVFLQYHTFHFFHFCLSEVLVSVFIILSVVNIIKVPSTDTKTKHLLMSVLFLSLAVYTKIQYIYLMPLLPAILMAYYVFKFMHFKVFVKSLSIILLALVFAMLLYILMWYWPNKQLLKHVLETQTGGKLIDFGSIKGHLLFLIKTFFFGKDLIYFSLLFLMSYLVGIYFIFTSEKYWFKYLFVALSIWLFIESHKLVLSYFPTRYFISLFFAMGLTICTVSYEVLQSSVATKGVKSVFAVLLIFMFVVNINHFYKSFERRSFEIKEANNYLSGNYTSSKPIIGPWASTLAWNSKAMTLPVWSGYFNDTMILDTFNPLLIVSEEDEACSDNAFIKDGVNLSQQSDSIKVFTINKWQVGLYWLQKK